jgi:uncharacterized protein (DUF1330 family)
MLCAVALGTTIVTGVKVQKKPPVYVVIDISETMNADAYIKAVKAAEPKATQAAEGRFVIRTNKTISLDGPAAPDRFVVIAFDSEEQAKAWHNSQAIKEVNAVRMKTTKSRSFIVDGLAD